MENIHNLLPERDTINSLPWDRLCARLVDLGFNTFIIYLSVLFEAGLLYYWLDLWGIPVEWSNYLLDSKIINFVITWIRFAAVFIIYEMVFLKIFCATPGKLILKMKISNSEGGKLSLKKIFARTISIYFFGLCFRLLAWPGEVVGIMLSGMYYKKKGYFLWDKNGGYTIARGPVHKGRYVLATTLALFYVFYLFKLI